MLAVAALAVIATCARLGLWQLQRAAEKEERKAVLDERARLPAVVLRADTAVDAAWRYRRVVVHGRFDGERQVLLDNQVRQGRAGVKVYTPLRIEGGPARVLVDRGWLPLGADRARLPPHDAPAGEVTVHGVLDLPDRPGLRLGGAAGDDGRGERLWPYLDLDRLARGAQYPLLPLVICMEPADPHGYARALPAVETKRAMHIGYALQWFAFALIAGILWWRLARAATSPAGDAS